MVIVNLLLLVIFVDNPPISKDTVNYLSLKKLAVDGRIRMLKRYFLGTATLKVTFKAGCNELLILLKHEITVPTEQMDHSCGPLAG